MEVILQYGALGILGLTMLAMVKELHGLSEALGSLQATVAMLVQLQANGARSAPGDRVALAMVGGGDD